MTQKTKGIILWIIAIIFTLGIAVYQRTTGPTYPTRGSIEFSNNQINYKLLRSANSGEYWTGWPFGEDLTDNKTLVAWIGWLVAWLLIKRDAKNRYWAIIAAILLLAVYLIPHSMFGSELDYDKGTIETGN